ncbi:MAG: metallophosphoesterase [Candidatus Woesearchaeota archaeon]|jgi:Icc-related predicted phosphoesterase
MNIFTFTDLHSDIASLQKIVLRVNKKDIDIVVSCGDLTNFGMKIEEVFLLLSKIKKTVLLIPGNHESDEEMNYFCNVYKNCVNINHKKFIYKNTIFVGYGDGGFVEYDPRLKLLSKQFKKYFKEFAGNKILVLHGPPYGTKCDNRSAWFSGERFNGSKTARTLILESKIDLALCGHIHECEGCQDMIGKTLVLNPSYKGKIIALE